jgi:hypothetical protein
LAVFQLRLVAHKTVMASDWELAMVWAKELATVLVKVWAMAQGSVSD